MAKRFCRATLTSRRTTARWASIPTCARGCKPASARTECAPPSPISSGPCRSRAGAHAVAILLTGMGVDGVEELKKLRDGGAVTIAQDKETSVVHGMPGAAIQIDAAAHVLSPDGIVKALAKIVRKD